MNVTDDHQSRIRRKGYDVYLLSRNFKENWFNYIWQSMIAGVFIFLIFFVLSHLIGSVILASIGSTVFCIFALPNSRTSNTRSVIGSYIICALIGLVCCFISSPSISGGISVGAAAFVMVITDTEHPPAAGVALGMALTPVLDQALIGGGLAFSAAIFALLLKKLLGRWLKDLV